MSSHVVQQVLSRLTLVPMVAAAVLGVAYFRRLPLNMRWLVGLLGFVLPLNTLGFVLMLQGRNNLFLMPVYAVGEFGLLALVYQHTLQQAAFTRLWPWLAGGFAVYVGLDSWFAPSLLLYRPSQQVVQALLVLLLVALYFRKLLLELQVQHLGQEPMFWVSAGLLIYLLGYLQIALFSNYLLRYSLHLTSNVWSIHSLLFIMLYSCYCRALWLTLPK